jgi:disulfide oxidoreductase YuzD
MNYSTVLIKVYGAEQICASCAQAPSSVETASWLEAALGRRFGDQIKVTFVDIYQAEDLSDEDRLLCQTIFDEDRWYPIVTVNGKIVAEGNPQLKPIVAEIGAHLK